MKKNNWSKIIWLILGLVPLLLIACGGGAAAPTATAPAPATDEPVLPTAVPVLEEAVEMEEVEGETAVSDEIVPVTAKPRLIEFYADW
jgi:hypothetical protein